MQPYKGEERLEHDFFAAHVGDGLDEADAVEGKLDPVALALVHVEVVANEVSSVLHFCLG
jgi:hypothetical protein